MIMIHRRVGAAKRPVDADFRAVPSKSDTHRALVAAALAAGKSDIQGPLDAEDTRRTRDGLIALGFTVEDAAGKWTVGGRGGHVPGGGVLAFGESGTTCRLLTALAALGAAPSRLDGDARLRRRPLAPLLAALRGLGAEVTAAPGSEALPLSAGGRAFRGGAVSVQASSSSQFASALLMVGPCLPAGLLLELEPPLVSRPYVDLTIRTMAAFGVSVAARPDGLVLDVRPASYRAGIYPVEGDWSSASYFLALPALVGGRVRMRGLSEGSAQPDARFASILREAGLTVRIESGLVEVEGGPGLRAFDIDASDCPDLVPTLAVVALAADGPCRMRGVGHLRHKESDRMTQLARNLKRLGAEVIVEAACLTVDGSVRRLSGTTIETASDHRMAMAFAVAGLRVGEVVLDDFTCVAKSNPGFWSDFARLDASLPADQNW
jgi:3-phosphoshikimate 1-carboxyvinyltransferase